MYIPIYQIEVNSFISTSNDEITFFFYVVINNYISFFSIINFFEILAL